MPTPTPRLAPIEPSVDGAFLTIQFTFAVAVSLVLFTMLANVIVAQYARGAVRTAIDEAVRAGSRVLVDVSLVAGRDAAETTCEERAHEAFASLVPGPAGATFAVTCVASVDEVVGTATLRFPAWVPAYPDFDLGADAIASREQVP